MRWPVMLDMVVLNFSAMARNRFVGLRALGLRVLLVVVWRRFWSEGWYFLPVVSPSGLKTSVFGGVSQ